ncbi:MAG TPA: ABC transporter ATP-binding protein [Oligoflexia bacterium]|nr:ABC transporter ATP-binding protein [Oligoflexia bacterium]HMP26935.1 ABC transporter ATP-binding protein [Oligoflexia bacterium]
MQIDQKGSSRGDNKITLEVERLTLTIQGLKILDNISFKICRGKTVGIIGPNGSGKTSLFNLLSGFYTQDTGIIKLYGEEISNLPPYVRARRGLGRTFQNFGIFRDMTLLENIILSLESRKGAWRSFFPWSKAHKENRKEAMVILGGVNLENKADELAANLSGGQQRLLELARIMALQSQVLLLDEPTAGVAPKLREALGEQISLLKERDRTILIIEHDLEFIENFCDQAIVLNNGVIQAIASPTELRETNQLKW